MRLEEGQVITFHRRYLRVIDGDIDAGDGGGTGDSGIGSDSGDAGESSASVALGTQYLFESSQIGFLPLNLIVVDVMGIATSKHSEVTVLVPTTTALVQSPMAQFMAILTDEFFHALFCGTVNAGTK